MHRSMDAGVKWKDSVCVARFKNQMDPAHGDLLLSYDAL